MVMDPLKKYTLSQVSRATGVAVNTIRTWYQREHFKIGLSDTIAETNGLAHSVSLRTALAIGLAGKLTQMGVAPKRAADAAIKFAFLGSRCPKTEIEREPGCLWGDGTATILTLPADKEYGIQAQFHRIADASDYERIFTEQLFGPSGTKGATILFLDKFVNQILDRLDR